MIPFNIPPFIGDELANLGQAILSNKLCGDGPFTKMCQEWIQTELGTPLALLTPSCTAALEMAAILIDIKAGDEVIMPSYTFVSTANAFVLRGAKIVFIDVEPGSMNLDVSKIEDAITANTKAIVPVHYAGVSCDMDMLMALADKYSLWVIEDAAQAVLSKINGRYLGTIGHIGCFSFHETKNYTAGGEGGAILIQEPKLRKRAEIIREKGTDRSLFIKGQVDKYTWKDIGSSFLLSDLQAAFLYTQLKNANLIKSKRLALWQSYADDLSPLKNVGLISFMEIPSKVEHNAHMFFIKCKTNKVRGQLIDFLKLNEVQAVFHYVPLHSSPAGSRFGIFHGKDVYTTVESERLVRLPLFFNMTEQQTSKVVEKIMLFFDGE